MCVFWFERESIISGNFGFAISACRLRERGRMSKSVYVRVFDDDLEVTMCGLQYVKIQLLTITNH